MNEPPPARFEILVVEGPPHGDLYELEQTTYYHVVDKRSGQTILTFERQMEAGLSTDCGLWDGYRFSGVDEVRLAPEGNSVLVRTCDGREESVPLPCPP
jgi:hypothetical protein